MIFKKDNVERIANTEVDAEKLERQGFERVDVEIVHTAEEPRNLQDMTVPQLKSIAKEKGIDRTSTLTKEELLEVLKGVV